MFSRVLIFVLLGCALAFLQSSSAAEVQSKLRVRREQHGEKVAAWWHNLEDKVSKFAQNVKDKITNWWDKITGRAAYKAKQQELLKLKQEYEALKEESERAVRAKKEAWQKVLAENEKRLAELKNQAESEVEGEINGWNNKFDQLQEKAEVVIKS
ncbi:venom protein Z precursor [Nasonia vitripennis]|uniref:Uncharacterized protein n=1 Tax=Nasonia vitripennis TaxID=7425 RepID=A0A7M6W8D5_NASVI|nr:venom protein Z precursor [Nasonia vitripennis]